MKFKESFKKPLTTLFVFIIGIFVVSGLSYISTVMGAAPSNPTSNNAFIPINTGSTAQGRCVAKDTTKPISISSFYTDCKGGELTDTTNGLHGSALLITNGVLVKTPNTTFQITGDPSSSRYKYGALYVGCTNDLNLVPELKIRERCGNYIPSNQPETQLYGDIEMVDLIDQNQTVEKPLCISAGVGSKYPGTDDEIPEGEVMVCQ